MTQIYVQTRFEAMHHWPEAIEPVQFLAHPHRHEFHVKAWFTVSHENRQREFLITKRALNVEIERLKPESATWSCEQWAEAIAKAMEAFSVDVSEDGENGAVWTRDN